MGQKMKPSFKVTGNYQSVSTALSQTFALSNPKKLTSLKEVTDQIKKDNPTRVPILVAQNEKEIFYNQFLNRTDPNYVQGDGSAEVFTAKIRTAVIHHFAQLKGEKNLHPATDRIVISFGYLNKAKQACGFSIFFLNSDPTCWAIAIINNAADADITKRDTTIYLSNTVTQSGICDDVKNNTVKNLEKNIVNTLYSAPEYAMFLKHIILPDGTVNKDITDKLSLLKGKCNQSNSELLKSLILYGKLISKIKMIEEKAKILENVDFGDASSDLKVLAFNLREEIKKLQKTIEKDDNKIQETVNTFCKGAKKYIKNALNKKTIQEHRGAAKIVYNVALAIAGLGVLYGIAAGIHYWSTGGKHMLFNPPFATDSERKVKKLADEIKKLRPSQKK